MYQPPYQQPQSTPSYQPSVPYQQPAPSYQPYVPYQQPATPSYQQSSYQPPASSYQQSPYQPPASSYQQSPYQPPASSYQQSPYQPPRVSLNLIQQQQAPQTYQPYQPVKPPSPQNAPVISYQPYQPVKPPSPQTASVMSYQPYQQVKPPSPQSAPVISYQQIKPPSPVVSTKITPVMINDRTIVGIASGLDQPSFFDLLELLAYNYHNGTPLVLDYTFDQLQRLYESKYGKYGMIGAEPIGEAGEMVDLPYFLSSLDKPDDEAELNKWIAQYHGPWLLEDKIDGATLLIRFSRQGVKIYTRGRGVKGQDVSHVAPFLKLPNIQYDLDVRGECVLTKDAFQRIKGDYKSSRNLVPGILRGKKSFDPVKARELSFYAYRIMTSNDTPEQQANALAGLGFLVPHPVLVVQINKQILDEFYRRRDMEAPYEMDGLVVYQNQPIYYPNDGNPKQIIAFKPEGKMFSTVVTDITWQSSKDRKLIPVVHFADIDEGSSTLTKTSGDNASNLVIQGIGIGAHILVERRGGVIPRIMSVEQRSEQIPYPDPNVYGKYVWDQNKTHLVMLEDNDDVIVSRLHHFLETLGIKNFGPQRLKLLVTHGVRNSTDLMSITPQQMVQIQGIGNTVADSLFYELRGVLKGIAPSRVLDASGIFAGVGEKRFEAIFDAIPNFLSLSWQMKNNPLSLADQIRDVHGFDKLADVIADHMDEFWTWMAANPIISFKDTVAQTTTLKLAAKLQGSSDLTGLTFVFSGKRPPDLMEKVKLMGGKIGSAVSKNTSYVVLADLGERLGKANDAARLGVPVISHEQLRVKFGL